MFERTVTYYNNESESTVTAYYPYNSKANEAHNIIIPDTERTGSYEFVGYTKLNNITSNTTSKPELTGNNVSIPTNSENTTVYIVYGRTWIFKYGLNGENTNTIIAYYPYLATESASYSQSYTPPTIDGYTFVGWTTTTQGASANGKVGTLTVSSGTFVAEYVKNEYDLTIIPDGGIYDDSSENVIITQEFGTIYELLIPTRTGYVFGGWKLTGIGELEDNKFTFGIGDATVTAIWIAEDYTVNFDANGGTLTGRQSVTVTYDSTAYSAISASVTLTPPTGYTFAGWYTAASGGEKVYDANGNAVAGTYWNSSKQWIKDLGANGSSMTLYAHWLINTYDIDIALRPDGYGTINQIEIIGVPHGTSIHVDGDTITIGDFTIIATPKDRDEQYTYIFIGWSVSDGQTITGAITIIATFDRVINNYEVTIEVNDSTLGSVDKTSITVPYGTAINTSGNTLTIGSNTITATPKAIEGYTITFTGWSNASGTVTGARTITANFEKEINNYKLIVNVNNSEYGTVNGEDSLTLTVPYGTTFSTNENVLTISGQSSVTAIASEDTAQYAYSFVDWSVESGSITGDTTITANFKYAIKNYVININVNNTEYGTVTQSIVKNVPYGTTYSMSDNVLTIDTTPSTTVTANAKTDTVQYRFYFENWTDSEGLEITSGTVNGDVSLTANFNRALRQYKVTIEVASDSTGYGTVNPTNVTVDYGTSVIEENNTLVIGTNTITATATSGNYTFDYWEIPSSTVNGEMTIYVHFARLYDLTYSVLGDKTGNEYSLTVSDSLGETIQTITREDMKLGGSIKVKDGNEVIISGATITDADSKVYQLLYTLVDGELTTISPVADNINGKPGSSFIMNANKTIELNFVDAYVTEVSGDALIDVTITSTDSTNSADLSGQTVIAQDSEIQIEIPYIQGDEYFYVGFKYTTKDTGETNEVFSDGSTDGNFEVINGEDSYIYTASGITIESIELMVERQLEFDSSILSAYEGLTLKFVSSLGFTRTIIVGNSNNNFTMFEGNWTITVETVDVDEETVSSLKTAIEERYNDTAVDIGPNSFSIMLYN